MSLGWLDRPVARIVPGAAGAGGYRRLVSGRPDDVVVRTDLGGTPPCGRLDVVLSFAHLSDLHVADVQSPARAEFLDRLADLDHPLAARLGRLATYRPQEALTAQVAEAMAAAVRAGPAPAAERAFDFAVVTGDATDNAQRNELAGYLALLDGGPVRPDSGDAARWEGVGGDGDADPGYWHPDGAASAAAADRPSARYGFPRVPGLLDAARAGWDAGGLGLPWYAAHGNHDGLLAGTVAADPVLMRLVVGGRKPMGWRQGADLAAVLGGHDLRPPPVVRGLGGGAWRAVTPDPARAFGGPGDWVAAHCAAPGQPRGHGLTPLVPGAAPVAYFGFDAGPFRCLVLDTVNPHGGWQGSLDRAQFDWLTGQLDSCHPRERPALLFSHHPFEALTNAFVGPGEAASSRVLGAEVGEVVGRRGAVRAWFTGHLHRHRVSPLVLGGAPLWQVGAAAHIDWPQQARVVDIAVERASGQLVIRTRPLDHSGVLDPRGGALADPTTLAGWSRELAANAWQERDNGLLRSREGGAGDRCVALVLPPA